MSSIKLNLLGFAVTGIIGEFTERVRLLLLTLCMLLPFLQNIIMPHASANVRIQMKL